MGQKIDADASPGIKMLRIYRYLLVNDRRHYQSELAERFCCSPQTIIRIMGDIEYVLGSLMETGIENRRRWYRIRPKGELANAKTFEEVRYLSICRDLAEDSLPPAVLGRIDDTIHNLENHMASCYPAGPASGAPLYFHGKGRINYDAHIGTLSILLDAIKNKSICEITYRQDTFESFKFCPACLLHMDEAVFVAGAKLGRDNDFTNLAVHRIIKITLLEENFDIDFPDYSKNMFGLPCHEPRTFRILFEAGETAIFIAERQWSDQQRILLHPDGTVELEITTQSEEELRAWVRSFGTQATFIDPSSR